MWGTALAAVACVAAACTGTGAAGSAPGAATTAPASAASAADAASPAGTASSAGANWPEYDGNAARTGVAADVPPAGPLTTAWSADLDGAVSGSRSSLATR